MTGSDQERFGSRSHEGSQRPRSAKNGEQGLAARDFVQFVLRDLRSLRRLRDPAPPTHILRAMLAGATLKAHRTLDGAKIHILHLLDGPDEIVDRAAVDHLRGRGLIASNMKFPAATYVLTERGVAVATRL